MKRSRNLRAHQKAAALLVVVVAALLHACQSPTAQRGAEPVDVQQDARLGVEISPADSGIDIISTRNHLTVSVREADGTKNGAFRFFIDDAPGFSRPMADHASVMPGVTIDRSEVGMVPGIRYFVRAEPAGTTATLKLKPANWSNLLPNNELPMRLWEVAGRAYLQRFAGVRWTAAKNEWRLVAGWPPAGVHAGERAYYLEHALRGALNLALVRHDLGLLDELAAFLVAYLPRFQTMAELRAGLPEGGSVGVPDGPGGDRTKILAWFAEAPNGGAIQECALCTIQLLHPVARLIRIVSTLPDVDRTASMERLVRAYVPIIVRDHLIRLTYGTTDPTDAGPRSAQRVGRWQEIAEKAGTETPSVGNAMRDTDLWLIATAAEILGAQANRPGLVRLSGVEAKQLQRLVAVGVELFQSKRTLREGTRDFERRVVGSATYFDGDFDQLSDMAYAGYTGREFPKGARRRPNSGSWDISHAYRIPLFLRSLYDNRKATGLAFPGPVDIALVVNQYIYVVFNGDFDRPLFANFFDGHDGWYRVGYHGKDFGCPPSIFCDSSPRSRRPCLTLGAVSGWGLLAFINPDLERLQASLISLAADQSPEAVKFRQSYYESMAMGPDAGNSEGWLLLFTILTGTAEHFDTGPIGQ